MQVILILNYKILYSLDIGEEIWHNTIEEFQVIHQELWHIYISDGSQSYQFLQNNDQDVHDMKLN